MSVFRASSLCPPWLYACGPRAIATGGQRVRPLVARTEVLPPTPPRRRLPVTHTSPPGQPPLARRRARGVPEGAGSNVHVNFLRWCRGCQGPFPHFSPATHLR